MDEEIERLIVSVRADTGAFARDVAEMRAQLEGPLAAGVERAGRVLENALVRAVTTGKLGFEDLKRVALAAMAEIAAAAIRNGLNAIAGGKGGGGGGGACWIVAPGAVGAWAGRDHSLAIWSAGGWRFAAPAAGMRVWNRAAEAEWRWTGSAWSAGELFGSALVVDGEQVVAGRQPAIASPSGGTIIDAEGRAAVDQIIVALKSHGLID